MDLATIQAGGGGPFGAVARAGLAALAVPYRAIASRRLARYGPGGEEPERLPVRVVCVGNLTAGGTGKTPFVAWLVGEARARGLRPAILARGYGPRPAGSLLSDEGGVLRDVLGPEVPIVEDPDRVRGGRALLAAHPTTDLVVLDDGFQHRRLARDVDLVLLDATNPFGHDRLLPRGLLREPVEGLARAHGVVVTRMELVDAETRSAVLSRAQRLAPSARFAMARTVPSRITDASDCSWGTELLGARVFLWAGIGNPRAFEALVRGLGAVVVGRRFDRDHARIGPGDLAAVRRAAAAAGASRVVVTRKDLVKLRALGPVGDDIDVLDIATEVVDGAEGILALALAR
jgi:tetraacyldisaccharide 4'-kinase